MLAQWPVVGRTDELARIRSALRRGVGAVVIGEAGVGKTMLLRELKRRAEDDGHRVQLALAAGTAFPLAATEPAEPPSTEHQSPSPEPQILLVDDAHLLDAESAGIVWRQAATHALLVVVAVRAGEAVPADVDRLWTSGECERLELEPFTEADVRALLESVLGGDVEDRVARLLFTRSGGNALLLRELVRSGVDSGALASRHEVWSLSGELPLGGGVRSLIRGSLTGLTEDELVAAQLLAVGEPIALPIVDVLVAQPVQESLEAQGVVSVQDTVDGLVLTLAHPLYGEVLRDDIATLRLRRLRLHLAQAIEDGSQFTAADAVRVALLRVEAGADQDPAVLLDAARLARTFNASIAERLAEAAVDSGGSPDARIMLASLLTMRGQVARAQSLLADVSFPELSPTLRGEFAAIYAFVQAQGGQLSEAAAMTSRLAAESAHNLEQLQGIHAQALTFDGRLDEGLRLALNLFDHCDDDVARTLAAMALIAGSHFRADVTTAGRVFEQATGLAESTRDRLPYAVGTINVARSIGLTYAGRFAEAESIAQSLYERGLAEDDPWLRPRGASGLGVLALARGQARTAARYLRIAVASLNDFDRLFLRYNLALLVRGLVHCGAVEEAERALRSGEGAPVFRVFEDDWALAQAGVLAARGQLGAAVEQALRTARAAEQLGSWGLAVGAAHDAVRYGGGPAAAQVLQRCAGHADGPMFAIMAEDGAARAAADGNRLDTVRARFEDLGAKLLAAESAYAAAAAHRTAGDLGSAATSLAQGITLHGGCEGAVVAWIAPQGGGLLTVREQQVAVLAAAGRTDAQIAVDLGIATRTVSTHLSNVYAKLGVTTRRELPEAL